MLTVLYVWCDCGSPGASGHYYTGERCPFSGWVAPFVREALQAAAEVERAGAPLTVEGLRKAGLTPEALARVLVAEFGDAAAVPEALGVGSSGTKRSASLPSGDG